MPIRITCPSCEASYCIGDNMRGKKMRCRECEDSLVITSGGKAKRDEVDEVEEAEEAEEVEEPVHPPTKNKSGQKHFRDEGLDDDVEEAEVVRDESPRSKKKSKDREGGLSPIILIGGGVGVAVVIGVILMFVMNSGDGTSKPLPSQLLARGPVGQPVVSASTTRSESPPKPSPKEPKPPTEPPAPGKTDTSKPDASKRDAGKPDAGKPDAGKPDAVAQPGDKFDPSPPPPALTEDQIYAKTLQSTVYIVASVKAPDGKVNTSQGTGSLINREQQVVITNAHVIEGDGEVEIRVFFPQRDKDGILIAENKHYQEEFLNGKGLRGKVLAADDRRDLALVHLEGDLPQDARPIRLATKRLAPGQRVLSIAANPKGSDGQWVRATGTIDQVCQRQWKSTGAFNLAGAFNIRDLDARVVEVKSSMNPGDSGGPVVNERAEQIAVTQGGWTSFANLMNAIDIDEAKKLLRSKSIDCKIEPAPIPSSTQLAELGGALKSGNLKVCQAAAAYFADLGPEAESLRLLIDALDHRDALVRQSAARALGAMGESARDAVQKLVKVLDDVDVQGVALEALAQMGPSVVVGVPKAVKLLESDRKDVREGAARVLMSLGPQAKQAVPALIRTLSKGDAAMRQLAVQTLGSMGAQAAPAIRALAQLLKEDKEAIVRERAARALEQVGKEKAEAAVPAVPALAHAVRNDLPEVKVQAAKALGAIGPKAEALLLPWSTNVWIHGVFACAAVPDLGAGLQEPEVLTRLECAIALARFGPGAVKALGPLTAAAYSTDADTRYYAILAIAEIGPKAEEAIPALLWCLRQRPIKTVTADKSADAKGPGKSNQMIGVVKSIDKTYVKLFGASVQALAKIGEPARTKINQFKILKTSPDLYEAAGAALAIEKSNPPKHTAKSWAANIENNLLPRMPANYPDPEILEFRQWVREAVDRLKKR